MTVDIFCVDDANLSEMSEAAREVDDQWWTDGRRVVAICRVLRRQRLLLKVGNVVMSMKVATTRKTRKQKHRSLISELQRRIDAMDARDFPGYKKRRDEANRVANAIIKWPWEGR